MTKGELETIRKRSEEATDEPWHYVVTTEGTYVLSQDSDLICSECGREQDARFIAGARRDIPALLDYIEELESKITQLCPIANLSAVDSMLVEKQHILFEKQEMKETIKKLRRTE
ncbi:hypothetical protein NMK43_08490 [Bacillus licheniformis]|uniref:hypothetical protein n=1 Tax=Bacillus licheniformis TaxID=1402 RepID=UPI0020C8767E|nr:hypothetical protein [Bacillus licheniformis]MCP8973132.1 hypothetical protein [Bacillus licheniformis]